MKSKSYSNELNKLSQKRERNNLSLILKLVILIIFFIVIFLLILSLKISKFDFVYNQNFFNYNDFKIIGLNTLKDQSIFFFEKSKFEEEIKNKFPEIYEINYEISGLNSLKVTFKEKGLCCVIFDIDGKIYLISNSGNIVRRLDSLSIDDETFKINSSIQLNESVKINPEVIKKLLEIDSFNFGEKLKYENVSINGEKIILFIEDGKEIIIDQNTNLEIMKDRFVEITSYLKSSSKDYLSLDFRFEKIVVK
jgi:hypothetical protein